MNGNGNEQHDKQHPQNLNFSPDDSKSYGSSVHEFQNTHIAGFSQNNGQHLENSKQNSVDCEISQIDRLNTERSSQNFTQNRFSQNSSQNPPQNPAHNPPHNPSQNPPQNLTHDQLQNQIQSQPPNQTPQNQQLSSNQMLQAAVLRASIFNQIRQPSPSSSSTAIPPPPQSSNYDYQMPNNYYNTAYSYPQFTGNEQHAQNIDKYQVPESSNSKKKNSRPTFSGHQIFALEKTFEQTKYR